MKRFVLLFWLLCTVMIIQAAQNVKVGKLWYSVNNAKTEATVIAVPAGKEDTYKGPISIPATISGTFNDDSEFNDVPVISITPNAFRNAGITSVNIEDGLTSIGASAFYNSTITDINIPASVTVIKELAFSNCSAMEEATFSSIKHLCSISFSAQTSHPLYSAKHLYIKGSNEDEEVTNITIPDDITAIKDYTFFNCSSLTSVTIPDNVTSIGWCAFYNCSSLTSVIIPDNVTQIGNSAFYGCSSLTSVNIPDNITQIENSAFGKCSSLISIDIPDNVTQIDPFAFSGCSSLTSVSIPNTVETIGYSAFEGCSSLTNLEIPDGVETIADYAFTRCTSLKTVKIPSSVKNIKTYAFRECENLEKATFSTVNSLCSINYGSIEANPLYYAHHLYIGDEEITTTPLVIPESSLLDNGKIQTIRPYILAGASYIQRVDLPAKADSIGVRAFYGCTGLLYVNYATPEQLTNMDYGSDPTTNPLYYAQQALIDNKFPSTIPINTDVNEGAFANAKWLETVELGEGVTHIGKNAFNGCSNLQFVKNIPSGLKTIGEKAFWGCTNLSAPNLNNATALESIGYGAFHDCKSGSFKEISIPDNCKLGNAVFELCSKLVTVKLPAGLDTIPKNLFDRCYNLQDVEIPSSVTFIHEYAFRDCQKLTTIKGADHLTKIGQYAFSGCLGITDLLLPSTIDTISKYAFSGCKNMTMISLPASLNYIYDHAFNGCTKLANVFSHGDAPVIGEYSFGGLQSGITFYVDSGDDLTEYKKTNIWKNDDYKIVVKTENSIEFYINDILVHTITQDGGTTIDAAKLPEPILQDGDVFSGWDKQIPSTMPSTNTKLYGYVSTKYNDGTYKYHIMPNGNHAILLNVTKELTVSDTQMTVSDNVTHTWNVTIKIPNPETENVTIPYDNISYPIDSIAPHAFEGKNTLQKITLPANIQKIGNAAFKGCSNLMKVENFDKITEINDSLFLNCSSLNALSITLSPSITKIGRAAFANCNSLELNKLPTSLQTIGFQALANTKITTITLANTVTLDKEVFKGCKELKTVTFAENYDKPLQEGTFWNCTALEDITLPGSMPSILQRAFDGCTKLSTIILPEGFNTIYNEAFKGCSQLTSVTLPSTFMVVGPKAFSGCTSLSQIRIDNNSEPAGTNDTFEQTVYDNAYLFVKDPTKYKSEPWSNFKHKEICKKYKLTYMVDGETYTINNEPQTISYMVGESLTPISEPVKAGHEFSGWQGMPAIMPGEDVEVTGKFKYKLSFSYADGSEKPENDKEFSLPADKWYFYGDAIDKDALEAALVWAGYHPTLDTEIPTTMPAEDLNVIVTYEKAEYDYKYDNVNYRVYTFENRAEVVSAVANAESVTIPASITYTDNNSYPVTLIRPRAFQKNRTIETAIIGDGVKTIGDMAFQDCEKLKTITLPATLDSIGLQAFSRSKLTSVTVPYAPKMGKEIFYSCTKLKDINFSPNLTKLPESVFRNCKGLEEIDIPDHITKIGESAFDGCSALKTVELSEKLDTICDGAFSGCSAIDSLTLPSSVQEIGNMAFYGVFGKDEKIKYNGSKLPEAKDQTFDQYAYENALLKTSATELSTPWSNFVNHEPLEEGGTSVPQCRIPVITYGGKNATKKIVMSCETEGATIVSSIKVQDVQNSEANEITLWKTFTVTAYAKKDGMRRSNTVIQTFQFEVGDVSGDGKITPIDASLTIQKYVGKIE